MTHIAFPSIRQFRDVVKTVQQRAQYKGNDEAGEPIYDRTVRAPKITYKGHVKLHGTNAAIVARAGQDGLQFQSRERVLTLEKDNAGFYAAMMQQQRSLMAVMAKIAIDLEDVYNKEAKELAIYGEWCGGSIQKNVALNQLPKMFVVFKAKFNGEWVYIDPHYFDGLEGFHHIDSFPVYLLDIDFENPHLAQDSLIKITNNVEAECPVGKQLGVSGIGEGVVWSPLIGGENSSDYWFKVKGEKHSASTVKTLAAVDVEAIESINRFVEATVTEARLEQGLQNLTNEQLKPFTTESIGDFIRWIHGDIIKEESDTIIASGFDVKKLGGPIAKAAKTWYFKKLQEY